MSFDPSSSLALRQRLAQAAISLAKQAAIRETKLAIQRQGRRNHGLGPVAIDPSLEDAARNQVMAMARADKLSHEVGGNFTARLDGAGFTKNAAVENVSAGYHTLAEAFSGWRQSKPHNENMLNPRMRRMGIATAYAPASKYKVFWVLVMAD